ncbi:MAG: hypothetical protein HY738_22345 [Bacteroidia bacterium]|nr:hypothetical protein [Bacteroidia bacterium]
MELLIHFTKYFRLVFVISLLFLSGSKCSKQNKNGNSSNFYYEITITDTTMLKALDNFIDNNQKTAPDYFDKIIFTVTIQHDFYQSVYYISYIPKWSLDYEESYPDFYFYYSNHLILLYCSHIHFFKNELFKGSKVLDELKKREPEIFNYTKNFWCETEGVRVIKCHFDERKYKIEYCSSIEETMRREKHQYNCNCSSLQSNMSECDTSILFPDTTALHILRLKVQEDRRKRQ